MTLDRKSWSCRWVIVCAVYLLVLAIIVALAYLRLIPTELGLIPMYDTIGHFVLMGSAAYLAHRALKRPCGPRWSRSTGLSTSRCQALGSALRIAIPSPHPARYGVALGDTEYAALSPEEAIAKLTASRFWQATTLERKCPCSPNVIAQILSEIA